MFTKPTVEDFKLFFARDFPFGTDPDQNILDSDIERARTEADCLFNESLFLDQDCFSVGYNYLVAHQLTENIRNSSQGISGKFEGLLSSKSVSSVSASYNYPSTFMESPTFLFLLKTTYGAKYLELVYPQLIARPISVAGRTNP